MSTDLTIPKEDQRAIDAAVQAVTNLFDNARSYAVDTVIKVGREIETIHDRTAGKGRDGKFRETIEGSFDFTVRMAYNYLSAYRVFRNCKHLEYFDSQSVFLLSKDSTPEEAYTRALAIARNGKTVTKDTVQTILDHLDAKAKKLAAADDPKTSVKSFHTSDDEDEPADDPEPEDEPQEPVANQLAGKAPEPEDDPDDPTDISEPERKPAEPNELGELREHVFGLLDGLIEGKPPHYRVFLNDVLKEWLAG